MKSKKFLLVIAIALLAGCRGQHTTFNMNLDVQKLNDKNVRIIIASDLPENSNFRISACWQVRDSSGVSYTNDFCAMEHVVLHKSKIDTMLNIANFPLYEALDIYDGYNLNPHMTDTLEVTAFYYAYEQDSAVKAIIGDNGQLLKGSPAYDTLGRMVVKKKIQVAFPTR